MTRIKEALSDYRNHKILPPELVQGGLGKWVQKNTVRYIGSSEKTPEDATFELAQWFIAWYMFFPSVMIPSDPCKPPTIKLKSTVDTDRS